MLFRSRNIVLAAAVGIVAIQSAGRAATVAQYSFETPDVAEDNTNLAPYNGGTVATGFSITGGGSASYLIVRDSTGDFSYTNDSNNSATAGVPTGADGQQYVRFTSNNEVPSNGAPFTVQATSDASFHYTAGTTYAASFALGLSFDNNPYDASQQSVSLRLVDATTSAVLATSVAETGDTPTQGTFNTLTTAGFNPTSDGDLRLQISIDRQNGYIKYVDFDNVVLTATSTPEPASMTLLGAAGLAALRRRRR